MMIAVRITCIIVILTVASACGRICGDSVAAADEGAPRSLYSYDEDDAPAVFFFPAEQARWDGSKVTMKEWYLLTDHQKQKFISEYIAELERQYHQSITVMGLDYLEALNAFSCYSDGKAMQEAPTTFIEKMLDGQGKLPPAGTGIDIFKKSQ